MCRPDEVRHKIKNYRIKTDENSEIFIMSVKSLIAEELSLAGEASPVSPLVLQLDKFRIMSDTDVPPEEFLLRLFGKPCFPRRDLSTVTGSEKCGKTFFTSMLMACCARKNVLALERIREQPLKVMWYDTEQSRQSTKGILADRVVRLARTKEQDPDLFSQDSDMEGNFYVFNVRSCSYQERMDYLVAGIEAYKPDMVIIDNVSDLLPSVNDTDASIQVIGQLMQLASEYNCNITVVIHVNRSGEKRSLRGWLGTEILHKAYEVYYCEQIENTDTFSVEQTLTRKYRIPEKLFYRVNDDGLPEITVKPEYQPRDRNGQFRSNRAEAYQINADKAESFNQKYIIHNDGNVRQPWEWDLRQLFGDVLGDIPSMGRETLQNEVMARSGIREPKYFDKVFRLAMDQRVVQTTMDRNGRIVAMLIPS